jgi:hypothetical protein
MAARSQAVGSLVKIIPLSAAGKETEFVLILESFFGTKNDI